MNFHGEWLCELYISFKEKEAKINGRDCVNFNEIIEELERLQYDDDFVLDFDNPHDKMVMRYTINSIIWHLTRLSEEG